MLLISVQAQPLLEENFEYGVTNTDLVTSSAGAWVNFSGGSTTLDVQYLNTGLTYAGYVSSGLGGCAIVSNSRTGDDYSSFTSQNSGSLYLSALVNVISASSGANGEYFLNFGSTGTQYARLYAKNSSGSLLFGISKSTETPTFTSGTYSFNTTYLVVIKYTFNAAAQDDRVDLWVFSSGVPASEIEAGSPTVGNVIYASNDASSISSITLREGTNTINASIDGIRVATSWADSPLPVELTSFSAYVKNKTVQLTWKTATEIDNYGFEIERTTIPPFGEGGTKGGSHVIGFLRGAGNSNSTKEYSFTDKSLPVGSYSYRLKQIDNSGNFKYSKEVEANITHPTAFLLEQNYPNPFNPSTTISYELPENSYVKLQLFNAIGKEVATLVSEFQQSGMHDYTVGTHEFNLTSGVYFYTLRAGKFVQTKKMVVLK